MFYFMGVYGTFYKVEKSELWRGMTQKFSLDNIPRICGRDFNEFLWDHEKLGGVEVRYNRPRYLDDFMCKLEIYGFGVQWPQLYVERDEE